MPHELRVIMTFCEQYKFMDFANPNPPRIEIQYLGFRKISPKPDPYRIQLVRCNKHFAYSASRD